MKPVRGLLQFLILSAMILVMISGSFSGVRGNDLLSAALEADRAGNLNKAIDFYSRAIVSGQLNQTALADTLNDRGIIYRLKGRHDLAIEDYTQAIKLKADFAVAYSNRGLAYAKIERYDTAILDFTRAIELQPDNAMTYLKRGNAFCDKGDLDPAIADWTRALTFKPDLMRAYFNRCDAYDRKGRRDLAIEDCRKVLELEPDFQPARDALHWLTGPQTGERPTFCNY